MIMPSPQRIPAKERKISDIREDDARVNIVGTVVDLKDNIMILDDGSGKINITFEEGPLVNPGQLVRISGRIINIEGGMELQGELCQDFSNADIEQWRKISKLWEKSLKEL